MPRYIPEDILISDLRKLAHRFDEYFGQKAACGKKMYLSKKEVAYLFEKLSEWIRQIADTYGTTD